MNSGKSPKYTNLSTLGGVLVAAQFEVTGHDIVDDHEPERHLWVRQVATNVIVGPRQAIDPTVGLAHGGIEVAPEVGVALLAPDDLDIPVRRAAGAQRGAVGDLEVGADCGGLSFHHSLSSPRSD